MKILTIIGARPQIIKAAAISRAIRADYSDRIKELILHTGQHYDTNMSQVFFDEMEIPGADHNLNVGSGTHGRQTAAMMRGIEEMILDIKPDFLMLYGDTNSTLAGAVAGVKTGTPVVHIEAGLRSFNKAMPEEINRITCDHCSTLLFSPSRAGVENLEREGFRLDNTPPYTIDNPGVFHCGDVMYDNALFFSGLAEERSGILKKYDLEDREFILSTIHRDLNTDKPERLQSIFTALLELGDRVEGRLIVPLHPRTLKMLVRLNDKDFISDIRTSGRIQILPPVSFLDMIMLEKHCSMIITDSGGVQKESYFYQKPCIILRPETEWTEIVEHGSAIIADADRDRIIAAYEHFSNNPPSGFPPLYGDGKAAWFILDKLLSALSELK